MRKILQSSLRLVDRFATLRVLLASMLVAVYRRRGAHPGILDEAREGARDREAKRTVELIMWAGAVSGRGRFPQWFPAAHHIKDPANRERSARALRRHLESRSDAPSMLWRQYYALSEPDDLTEIGAFIEQDLERRLAARATAGDPDRSSMSSAEQLAVLRRATEALERVGIRAFLVSGTLLGMIRDGRLMAHDYDIDLGILPGEAEPNVVADALRSAGFTVAVQDLKVVGRTENDFAVDIFIHYERDGRLWHGTEIHEWWNTPFDLRRSELDDVAVWIPDDPERYLDENYGTWTRPIAFYNFSFDTPNRRYRNTYHGLNYLYRRVIRGLDNNDRWSAESAVRELRDNFGVDVTESFQDTPLLAARSRGTDVDPSPDARPGDVVP